MSLKLLIQFLDCLIDWDSRYETVQEDHLGRYGY